MSTERGWTDSTGGDGPVPCECDYRQCHFGASLCLGQKVAVCPLCWPKVFLTKLPAVFHPPMHMSWGGEACCAPAAGNMIPAAPGLPLACCRDVAPAPGVGAYHCFRSWSRKFYRDLHLGFCSSKLQSTWRQG